MRKQEQIKLVMSAFDFKKVHSVMTFLDWKWTYENKEKKIPSISDIKSNAEYCLNKVAESKGDNAIMFAGGLEARKENGVLGLSFTIEKIHPLHPLTNIKSENELGRKA